MSIFIKVFKESKIDMTIAFSDHKTQEPCRARTKVEKIRRHKGRAVKEERNKES